MNIKTFSRQPVKPKRDYNKLYDLIIYTMAVYGTLELIIRTN